MIVLYGKEFFASELKNIRRLEMKKKKEL